MQLSVMKIYRAYFGVLIVILVIIGALWLKTTSGLFQQSPSAKTVTLHIVAVKFMESIFRLHDADFAEQWKRKTGQTVVINHSYGSSGDNMRAVIAGTLNPDGLILAHPYELDEIARKTGLLRSDWRGAFPYDSSPFYSDVAFLVRKGNPKNIKGWNDLIQPGVSLVFSNPKSCGGGRWVYTAALGFATRQFNGDEAKIRDFMSKFIRNVPVFYANQNISGNAFVVDGKGDVLITYEKLALDETITKNNDSIEMIALPSSVEITIPVAVVTKNTNKNGTTDVVKAYLSYLYEPPMQEFSTKFYLRPRLSQIAEKTASLFPAVTLFPRDSVFPTNEIETAHLGDGGFFDSLTKK